MSFQILVSEAVNLLRQLISTPSLSRQEDQTACQIRDFLRDKKTDTQQKGNNLWAYSSAWDENKPTLLLNSHHDTVKPNPAWERDPFSPTMENGKLYGLGSNDAGGPLISLLATFLHFKDRMDLPFNLLFAATAEEEISGANGIASCLEEWPKIWAGIVGEPTSLDMAVAEKGLIVFDGLAKGKAGHAAREEGINAIYLALEDIQKLRSFKFPRTSDTLGPVKVTVTQIEAGSQHNVVPAECRFVVDVRTQDRYTNEEVVSILQGLVDCELSPRSTRLNSSGISLDHPLAQAGLRIGLKPYGSPTLSDQALLSFPTIKLGPGDSARSHTAEEYIELSEIEEGIRKYIELVNALAVVINAK
jgi:acetylornithine deacetylase